MHARRQLMASLLAVVGALALAPETLAAEAGGWFGMSLNVEVGGFVLSPTVTSASLLEVAPNSPAGDCTVDGHPGECIRADIQSGRDVIVRTPQLAAAV